MKFSIVITTYNRLSLLIYSIKTLGPQIFSASAWQLLLNRFYFTCLNLDNPKYQIRRFILLKEEDGSE